MSLVCDEETAAKGQTDRDRQTDEEMVWKENSTFSEGFCLHFLAFQASKTPKHPLLPPSKSPLGGRAPGLHQSSAGMGTPTLWANPAMLLLLPEACFQPDYLLIMSPTSLCSAPLPLPAPVWVLLPVCPHPGCPLTEPLTSTWPARPCVWKSPHFSSIGKACH